MVAVAVGHDHSVALTRDFRVYGWGLAEHGAIGMRMSNAKVPNEIKVMPLRAQAKVKFENEEPIQQMKIKEISCGAQHTGFVTVEGEAYMCGNGERGQLGIGIDTMKEYRPVIVQVAKGGKISDVSPKFKQISCGDWHTGFLTGI